MFLLTRGLYSIFLYIRKPYFNDLLCQLDRAFLFWNILKRSGLELLGPLHDQDSGVTDNLNNRNKVLLGFRNIFPANFARIFSLASLTARHNLCRILRCNKILWPVENPEGIKDGNNNGRVQGENDDGIPLNFLLTHSLHL